MAYDPCGTRKLEGDEILKRLAAYLGVSEIDLKTALNNIMQVKNSP
jgi:hypothetical protein